MTDLSPQSGNLHFDSVVAAFRAIIVHLSSGKSAKKRRLAALSVGWQLVSDRRTKGQITVTSGDKRLALGQRGRASFHAGMPIDEMVLVAKMVLDVFRNPGKLLQQLTRLKLSIARTHRRKDSFEFSSRLFTQ